MNATSNPYPAESEHRYFIGAALAIAVIVVAGFVPNYTLRLLHDTRYLTLLVHLHGLAMATWIALFLTQTMLIAKHRVDLHRKLGLFGAILIGLVLLAGIPVLINAAARQAHDTHSTRFFLMLIAFDGVNLLLFAGLAGCAIAFRRRSDVHKRLMLLATLNLLGPAFGRLTSYARPLEGDDDFAVLLLMVACAFACVAVDSLRHRRLHRAFALAATLAVASNLLTFMAKTWL